MLKFLAYITYKLSMTLNSFREPFYRDRKSSRKGNSVLEAINWIYSDIISQFLALAIFIVTYYGLGLVFSFINWLYIISFLMLISRIFLDTLHLEQINKETIKKYKEEKNPVLKSWLVNIFIIVLFVGSFFSMCWIVSHS